MWQSDHTEPIISKLGLGFCNTPHIHFKQCLSFRCEFPAHTLQAVDDFRAWGIVLVCSYKPSIRTVCVIACRCPMALVVRIEPNDTQTLLLCDDAREDLEGHGWLVFLEKFQGFNLQTAQEFTLSFDGCRAKVGDIQLEVTEDFLSQATGLPASGQKWFKNAKVEEVPWSLFFTSRKINGCDKGMPVSLLKNDGMVCLLC
jgi:hypothetical protein